MNMVVLITIIQAAVVIVLAILMTKFRIWRPKRTFYFALIYMACGLVAFVYLAFVSQNIDRAESTEFLKQQREENIKLSERLQHRDFSVLKEEHLKFTKTFEATAEDVTISRVQLNYSIQTVINWTDATDHKITVSYYETPFYMKRINISPYSKQPKITFSNNTIFIQNQDTKVSMKMMDMSVQMLENIEIMGTVTDSVDGLIGNRILYLNVPKHFNIIDNGI